MANKEKCVIVSGAPETDISYYKKYLNNSYIICADSGYLKCLNAGYKPDLIVGDFDSSPMPNIDCEIVKLNVRKDDTDTFHCTQLAIERGYKDITIVGGIGSRIDHTYSNVLSVNYSFDNNACCKLVNDKTLITIFENEIVLKAGEYKYFSIYSLFGTVSGLSITGAEYNVKDMTLKANDQIAQSNEFKDDEVIIKINNGRILLILSNE